MEAKERARRDELTLKRGEKDYKARQDKLVCPTCGNVQSFAEWEQGVKRCAAERCPTKSLFRPRIVWGNVEQRFHERQRLWSEKKAAKQSTREKSVSGLTRRTPGPRVKRATAVRRR